MLVFPEAFLTEQHSVLEPCSLLSVLLLTQAVLTV